MVRDEIAIQGGTVNVTDNTGLIQANGTGGIAIKADAPGGTADVTTSGAIQASSIAIVTDGLLTLNDIRLDHQWRPVRRRLEQWRRQRQPGRHRRYRQDFGDGRGRPAIEAANGTVTVSNSGDGVTTGIITAERRAIFANAVTVTNSGTISAMAAGGTAILVEHCEGRQSHSWQHLGRLRYLRPDRRYRRQCRHNRSHGRGGGVYAIAATNTVTVNNTSTGTIRSNGAQSIGAQTVNVMRQRRPDRSHRRGQQSIVATNVIVNNVSGGTITGVEWGIQAAHARRDQCPRGDDQRRHRSVSRAPAP